MGCRDDQWYRDRAKQQFHDEGTIEVDADSEQNCQVSNGGDNGAYVQAWVWVDDEVEDSVFKCDQCGDLDYALLDAYGRFDRIGEGVMFEIRRATSGEMVASPSEDTVTYLEQIKADKAEWCKAMAEYAAKYDVFQCPTCGADVDNPGLE